MLLFAVWLYCTDYFHACITVITFITLFHICFTFINQVYLTFYPLYLWCSASRRQLSNVLLDNKLLSYRIVSYGIVSYRIVSYRMASYRIVTLTRPAQGYTSILVGGHFARN